MKKRTIVALLLTLVLCIGAATTAFATSGDGNYAVPLRTAKFDAEGNNVRVGTEFVCDEKVVEAAAVALVKDRRAGGYKLTTVEKVKAKIDKKADVVIVDTMPEAFYKEKGHVPTAICAEAPLTNEEFTKAQKKALIKAVGKDKSATIIVYCGFTKCTRSHVAAAYLVDKGYENVYRMPGGSAAWEDAGYAFEK